MRTNNLHIALSAIILAVGAAIPHAHATEFDVTNGIDGNNSGQLTYSFSQAQTGDLVKLISGVVLNSTNPFVINNNITLGFNNSRQMGNAFYKAGTGTLTLAGVPVFDSSLNIQAGNVDAESDTYVTSGVTISAGATLSGNTIMSLNGHPLINSGTISPGSGSSVATLILGGSVTFNSGSTLKINVIGNSASELWVSGGTATFNNANLTLNVQPGTYTSGTTYTVVNAATIAGSGLTLTDPTTTSGRFSLGEVGSTYVLTYTASPPSPTATTFGSIGASLNQRNLGSALDRESINAPSAYNTLFNNLSALPVGQQQQALNQLNGTMTANMQNASATNARTVMSAIQSRLGGGSTGTGGTEVAMVDNDGPFQVVDADDSFWGPASKKTAVLTAWMQGFGEFDSLRGNSASASIDSTVGGGAVGVERHFLAPDDKVGVSFAAASDSISVQGVPQTGTQITYAVSLYGSKGVDVALSDIGLDDTDKHRLVLDGMLLAGYNSSSSTRDIAVTGETAQGQTDGYSAGVDGGVAYPMTLDEGSILTPRIGMTYTYNYENGYTETNAPVGGLTVKGNGKSMLQSSIGSAISHKYDLPDWLDPDTTTADTLTPEIHAAWTHEILNPQAAVTETFSGLAGSSFSSYGTTPDRDAAAIGIGLTYVPGEATQTSLYAKYDAVFSANETDQVIIGGFKYNW